MSRLSDLATKATMKAYAQGAAQNAVAPIADFLAPTVEVATPVGEYHAYDDKTRFQIPNTERAPGADAVKLGFGSSPATYNCRHNSLDIPVDIQEQDADEFALQDAINMASEVGSLAHEKKVIDLALAAVGSGTNITLSNSGTNLVSSLDTAILDILKVAGYGSLMNVGLLFGPTAFAKFRNHASVTGRFIAASNSKKEFQGIVAPTEEEVRGLLIGNKVDVRTSFMVYDAAGNGLAANKTWLLGDSIIVFARMATPTRRDPSFMKTFRLRDRWMVPGTYTKPDGRGEVAKLDWSCDPKVTNTVAAVRFNLV